MAEAQRPTRLRTSPLFAGQGAPAIAEHACALYSSRLQQDGGGQIARGRSVAAGNPAAAGGSCGRRPGSSGPRLARCCSRRVLLGTGEEGEHGVAFPGPRCPLCTPPWARVRWPLCLLLYHSPLSGPGAPAAAKTVSRRGGSARASALLAAGRASGRSKGSQGWLQLHMISC